MSEPTSDGPVSFGLVGVGWRAEFFLRVARELPHRFNVCGVVARDPSAGARVTAEWGVTAGNRRARYYTLTPDGTKQLHAEISQFERVIGAITRVIQTA